MRADAGNSVATWTVRSRENEKLPWHTRAGPWTGYRVASGDTVVRMDTDSGELIACNRQRCARVEPPDRAKTFGPLTVQFDSKPENALPAPTAETNKTP